MKGQSVKDRFSNKIGYAVLATIAMASCHSSVSKQALQNIEKKDTAKAISQQVSVSYMALDTIVDRDTIKVVLYGNTRIRCSINKLSDTINIAQSGINWDTSSESYINDDVMPILIPNEKKPVKFILNDSLLLLPICDGNARTLLYLLNRTKTSLKFSGQDMAYSLLTSSYYIYIDLKHNTIINYADEIYLDTLVNGIEEQIRRYPIFRYKIEHKRIVQINSAVCYFKEFEQLDMKDNELKDVQTFYNIILHHEDWEHDKYKLWK